MPKFRAKARAVDLLGKGQIADLPTAISELWKNGYDAYGDTLEAFLYMPDYMNHNAPLFVLSDDGKGMSAEDIVDKWFVLGTDSKSRRTIDQVGEQTLFKEPRVKMGEKGIGRLAVAYLGPQMLMLTKKQNNFLEAVFFDWRILENFDLFLEDIFIPSKTIESESTIHETFELLKTEFLTNFKIDPKAKKDPWKEQAGLKEKIISECKELTLPEYIIEENIRDWLDQPLSSHGTRFIIFNPDDQILELPNFTKNDETKDLKDDNTVNHTVSALAALFNLFKSVESAHATRFWVINSSGKYDLLNFKSFFNSNDFELSDHEIDGVFDTNGDFHGTVRIYKKEVKHTFAPARKKVASSFGPFELKLGYVSGDPRETSINHELYKSFNEKLELYGGLYIYRDGFRVLPYGRSENDFLEFEERRGKSAGDNFFAKRRMFGYIEITRDLNSKLTDKSSREGFVNNAAYRDFKSNLIAFFKDLAKKYFATHADYDYKNTQKGEFTKLAEAEKNERTKDKEARREFTKKLKQYPQELDGLETKYNLLVRELQDKIGDSTIFLEEIQKTLAEIETCKIQLQNLNLPSPTRYKPTDVQRRNLHAFKKQYADVQKTIADSGPVLQQVREKLKVHELFKEFEARHELFSNTLKNQFRDYANSLDIASKKLLNELNDEQAYYISDFESKFKSIIPPKTDIEAINQSSVILQNIFNDTREKVINKVEPFLTHLDRLNFEVNEDDLVGFYKLQFEEMKEEWNKTYELAQLGIAVEIIDHQFNTLYSQLANNIKSLEINLQPNNESEKKYKQLINAFHHLEDNYKLLQPLYRTTGRIRKDVTGLELFEYIKEFFGSRMKETGIKFNITPSGSNWTIFSFESIFKPVLINIVNNAIYWLQAVDDKEILIDFQDDKLIICNSGVPIEDFIIDDIFKLFYSERPKGRGIGLYLAKKSLNGIGYDIYATNDRHYNILGGASFIIQKIDKNV